MYQNTRIFGPFKNLLLLLILKVNLGFCNIFPFEFDLRGSMYMIVNTYTYNRDIFKFVIWISSSEVVYATA